MIKAGSVLSIAIGWLWVTLVARLMLLQWLNPFQNSNRHQMTGSCSETLSGSDQDHLNNRGRFP